MKQHNSAPIVVGYNGSAAAIAAAQWGFDHCVRTGRELLLAHESGQPSVPGSAGSDPVSLDHRDVDSIDDGIVQHLRRRHPESRVPIELAVDTQSPSAGLLERSESADLLVLGAGTTPHPRLIGGLTEHLAATALCPVVAVRADYESSPASGGGIAVGVTDSVAGHLALEFAVAEATRMGCALTAVVSSDLSGNLGGDRAKIRRWIQAETASPDLEITVRTVRADERPADVLIDVSASMAITVVGSHHSSDPWSIRLGPVAEAVLRLALSPVVMVGHREHRKQ